ncbi:hypothetical protein HJG60_010834 [Phyllostomus discolor]|uniref:Uncharacterized protein n=1 Tax=Phyllostomus discolor TaxID=89673 RepID=A0A834EAB0_9CHIR|nr:hypothetical protein HJG60_010834 [Phyllostomus discolor]
MLSYPTVVLISISLIISDVEQLSMYPLATCMLSLKKCLFRSHANVLIRLFGVFVTKLYEFCIYFKYEPLIRYIICKYFLPQHHLLFHFANDFLCYAEAFKFGRVPSIYFCFWYFCCQIQKVIIKICIQKLTTYVFF